MVKLVIDFLLNFSEDFTSKKEEWIRSIFSECIQISSSKLRSISFAEGDEGVSGDDTDESSSFGERLALDTVVSEGDR